MKVYPGILVLFALYLTFWVNQNYAYYSNEAGYCSNHSAHIHCYINNNDTQAIKSLLSIGSQGSGYYLYVEKRYSVEKGSLTLDIEISQNIRYLYMYLSYSHNHEQIILRASSINSNIKYMYCNQPVLLESQNFFNQFPGLTQIYFSDLQTNNWPSFSELGNLRDLTVRIKIGGNQMLDSTFFTELSNLRSLNLRYSGLTSIMDGTFENMDSLYYLYLDHNKISTLRDGTLRGLTYLRYLYLEDVEIRDISDNAFRDVINLYSLSLNENPDFPLQALIPLKKLRYLYLNFNNYKTIDPYVFQQMNGLKYIYMNNPFTCDCSLEWTSVAKQFGLYIVNSYCLDPIGALGRSVTNTDSYTNCTQTQSYQCFDKSVTCKSHEVCHNTIDSYYCGCPPGYEFNNIGHCNDIDECTNITNCQHVCVNTEGSFHCVCNEGYKLSVNGYDCEDINECQEGNGGCEFGCENTIGSYQCYCEVWQKLYDKTSCTNGIQCELVASTYDPSNCVNTESVFNCKRGFNLSIINLPCTSVNQPVMLTTMKTNKSTQTSTLVTTPQAISEPLSPTFALIIVLFIGVVAQTIVIIVLIIFIVKTLRQLKTKARVPINLETPQNQPWQESKHGYFNEGQAAENLKHIPSEMETIKNQTEMGTDVTLSELYPGNMDDGSVYTNVNQ